MVQRGEKAPSSERKEKRKKMLRPFKGSEFHRHRGGEIGIDHQKEKGGAQNSFTRLK